MIQLMTPIEERVYWINLSGVLPVVKIETGTRVTHQGVCLTLSITLVAFLNIYIYIYFVDFTNLI